MTRIVSQRCAYYATAAKIVEDQKLLTIIAKLCILDNCGRCDDYFFFKKLESCFHYVNIVAVKQCVIETQSWLVLFTFIDFFLYIFFTFQTNVFMHQSSYSYSSKTAPAQLYWVRSN